MDSKMMMTTLNGADVEAPVARNAILRLFLPFNFSLVGR
jgi:hypothetical protein